MLRVRPSVLCIRIVVGEAPFCDSYMLQQKLFDFTDNYSDTQGIH